MSTTKQPIHHTIDPYFIYLNWRKDIKNPRIDFVKDRKDSITINSTIGPYKNVYSEQVFEKNNIYVWQVKINSGNYFKIGIIKEKEIIDNPKFKAFSDSKNGYALFSLGKIRNGSNKDGAQFGKGYGPGDTVTVKFDTKEGKLSFTVNDGKEELAFPSDEFKMGGYVAAVAALH